MTIANPINFVNSYTNTAALNGLNAMGTLLEPYDGIGYTLMMGGNPAQMDIGIGIYTTAKFGRVLRYVGTMGQSERKLFDQLANQLSNMRPAHFGSNFNSSKALEDAKNLPKIFIWGNKENIFLVIIISIICVRHYFKVLMLKNF